MIRFVFSAVGWAWIEETEYADEFGDPAFAPREGVLEAVRDLMERLVPPLALPAAPAGRPHEPRFGPEALFRVDNGVWTVLIDTHRNHRQNWPSELFEQLARLAPGSFGFLHIYDDEHPTEAERFMRWTMVQGNVTVQAEEALRPIVKRWLTPYDDESE